MLPLLTGSLLLSGAFALDNDLGRTPQMGYNTWYDLMCSDAMNETTIRAIADAMVSKGLAALGYQYLNLDDCWADGRHPDGTVYTDSVRFPSGDLKGLADYAHGKGLLFGTYTDRGTKTCGGKPGSLNYEEIDARTYAAWGIDYVKEDSCFASTDHATAFQDYGKMRDALNATGRKIFFALCGWEDWYAPVGSSLGNSFRIGPDDTNWQGVLTNIDVMAGLVQYTGPGGWNDPCLLLSSQWGGQRVMTELQTRAQFSMWAVMAAPLLISGDIVHMSEATLETYSNAEVIRVSQDPLGKGGFLNTGPSLADVTCDSDCFHKLGNIPAGSQFSARDLWAPWRTIPDITDGFQATGLAPDGGHLMLVLTPKTAETFI